MDMMTSSTQTMNESRYLVAIGLLVVSLFTAEAGHTRDLTLAGVNAVDFSKTRKKNRDILIKAQVLLDRAGYSSGVIDGRTGTNFANAVRAFQERNELKPTGELDGPTWAALGEISRDPPLIEYAITTEDVKGPFTEEIPDSYEKKAELKRLGFTGPLELLAERFHMDEDLLTSLNRDKR